MSRYDTHNPPARLILVAVVCLVVLLIGAAIWLFGNDGSSDHERDASPGQRTTTTSQISRDVPTDPPAGGVALPEGNDQIDGYPTGFPASDLGAVAAQVAVGRAQIGFDYDQAAQVAGVYASPQARTVLEERSHAAVALRRGQAGFAVDGEVPAPASYAVTPIAFAVEELDTEKYAVSLLSYVSMTDADGKAKDFLYSGTQLFGWIEGDWKVVQASQDDLEHLKTAGQRPAVAPETPEYEQAGWIGIRGEYQ